MNSHNQIMKREVKILKWSFNYRMRIAKVSPSLLSFPFSLPLSSEYEKCGGEMSLKELSVFVHKSPRELERKENKIR